MPTPADPRRLALAPTTLARSVEEASVGEAGVAEGALFQVGELARATGKTVRAIHLYEELGLLTPHDRSKGRFRRFSREAVVRVRWISKLQDLGLTLPEIQEVVRAHEESVSAAHAAAYLRGVYAQKLEVTRRKLEQLGELAHELEASLHFLTHCDSSCCATETITSCPSCSHHAAAPAPDLVAGARVH